MQDIRKNEMYLMVLNMQQGENLTFCYDQLNRQIAGRWHNSSYFNPADLILENIIGSSYEYYYEISNNLDKVTFYRLKNKLSRNDKPCYISPDQRLY